MGIIKDKNGRDLVKAEVIRKSWKEYMQELYKEVLNEPNWTVVLEKTLESPLNCGDPTSPNHSWIFIGRSWNSNTLDTCWEELTHLKRPCCWERLKAGGEREDRGWDGWMGSLTRWTWVWASSGSWWWPGKPGVPQSMGSQRAGHDWATEPNWNKILKPGLILLLYFP